MIEITPRPIKFLPPVNALPLTESKRTSAGNTNFFRTMILIYLVYHGVNIQTYATQQNVRYVCVPLHTFISIAMQSTNKSQTSWKYEVWDLFISIPLFQIVVLLLLFYEPCRMDVLAAHQRKNNHALFDRWCDPCDTAMLWMSFHPLSFSNKRINMHGLNEISQRRTS